MCYSGAVAENIEAEASILIKAQPDTSTYDPNGGK